MSDELIAPGAGRPLIVMPGNATTFPISVDERAELRVVDIRDGTVYQWQHERNQGESIVEAHLKVIGIEADWIARRLRQLEDERVQLCKRAGINRRTLEDALAQTLRENLEVLAADVVSLQAENQLLTRQRDDFRAQLLEGRNGK